MQLIDNTPAPNDAILVPAVEHYGSASDQPSFEIGPEDQHHVDAVLGMDPFNDVPAPYDLPEGRSFGALKLTALPAEMQVAVRARLAAIPAGQREAKEAEFTAEAIRGMRPNIRLMTGLGRDATPYHREQLAITREYQDAAAEFDRLQGELSAVARHVTQFDPVTGKAHAVPVPKVSEERRRAIVAEMDSLAIRMRLLHNGDQPGVEAEMRLKQAMFETVQARKETRRQIDESAEAKRRAVEINRESRINEHAQRLAALTRNAT
ncbi:hypothetical protein OLX02_07630 [Novosphingobium sp. KCTC 2891]|uniref:hypothetical protein n=1 Tax=Novosphingobium sp. KCTC 2891 TaxID=2989730 RepID=UPI0022234254|nr:hypothetical protein [Novosphingobium sp. KCTC 2891]MCW1382692.1 hypothetical protein [Novosphingobium sp. KCTC 2891]